MHERRAQDDERLARLEKETKAQTKILVNIFKDMRDHRKEFGAHKDHFAAHVKEDDVRLSKLETNQSWIVRLCIALVVSVGTLFGIKA